MPRNPPPRLEFYDIPGFGGFTYRQFCVLDLLSQGMTKSEIAAELQVSLPVVCRIVSKMCIKAGLEEKALVPEYLKWVEA